MAASYAGLDGELVYMDRAMTVFGDAKERVPDRVKAMESTCVLPWPLSDFC